jgi:hypothetical protein
VTRRFNPLETVSVFLQSSNPVVTKSLKKSIQLFVEVLEDFRDDERFSTATGQVNLKDQFEGKPIIWQLNVKSSIIRSMTDDKHISLTAIGEYEPGETKEMSVCVEKKGELPIGDYLAQFLLLFANGMHMDEITTLRTAAMRVTYPNRVYSRTDPLEVHWQPYYEAVIGQDTPHDVRVTTTLALEQEHIIYIIHRLFNLDLDFELHLTHDELDLIFLDIFERCEDADVKRFIVARLNPREDAYFRLLSAREAGHDDERLLRAIDYAIGRMDNVLVQAI